MEEKNQFDDLKNKIPNFTEPRIAIDPTIGGIGAIMIAERNKKNLYANILSMLVGLIILLSAWLLRSQLSLPFFQALTYIFIASTAGGFIGILTGSKHKWIPFLSLIALCLGIVGACLAYMNSVGQLSQKEIQIPAIFFAMIAFLIIVYFIDYYFEEKKKR
jgi:hypothetical protein